MVPENGTVRLTAPENITSEIPQHSDGMRTQDQQIA